METLKFKTNIKCGGCIATVTPFLNNIPEISKWEVDTGHADKILTVEIDGQLDADTVIDKLQMAVYVADKV
jgi:copper chaperone